MVQNVPRILLAGVNSGCGKTTVTCAIEQALVTRGCAVGAFKCGPDYIDPMFHSRVIGAKSANLDLFFMKPDTIRFLLAKNARERDISIIEGVMGYYDGLGLTSTQASAFDVAQATETPTVLVVSAKGASLSVLAVIQGFLSFRENARIRGVILNQCSAMAYPALAREIEACFGIRAYGYLPKLPACSLESRHLGLVTADEVEDLHEKLTRLAEQAEKTIDLDGLLALATSAEPIVCNAIELAKCERVRIAVAQDRAFCFYYADCLDAMRAMGAELVPFSPLTDATLPPDIDGLYLGGGYPELYAKTLSENCTMRASVRNALRDHLPCIAECGGFMYLTEQIAGYPMVGALAGSCFDTGKLTRFGYVTLRAERDNLLCKAGDTIPAHEFHRWDCTACGDSFTAQKSTGKSWQCAVTTDTLYAGYPHIHFYANLSCLTRFYDTCLKEKHRHDRKYQTD